MKNYFHHKFLIYLSAGFACIVLYLYITGTLGIWIYGIRYISREYTADHIINNNSYELTIDLSNLESNIGNALFDDGYNKIYVDSVEKTINSGGYQIHFKSVGHYGLSGATLISALKHFTSDKQFSTTVTAEMIAEYKGKIYTCNIAYYSGINNKVGDSFGFYIFPSEAYILDGITLNETDSVKVSITNLCENIWFK